MWWLLGVGCVSVLLFLWYMGYWTKLKCNIHTAGPLLTVYEDMRGPYMHIGKTFVSLQNKLVADGITLGNAFAIFYDNPATVASADLRSVAGYILTPEQFRKLPTDKYLTKDIPFTKMLSIEFPYRNMLSFILAPFLVYPRLKMEITRNPRLVHRSGSMEVYMVERGKLMYCIPQENFDVFNYAKSE
eukprot:GILJ01004773.1.p1 GENE.GILJ01004773.1~~GILJ01004773.1.p1  ORF type:complete len:187 (+),score=9.17 GILJ01004773.1:269-829(+)